MTPRKTSIGHETAAHWALFRRATGYAHVGTDDRSLDSQTDTFSGAEAEKIFADKLGGSKRERPEPNKMLGQFRGGDVAIVTKYNRLGRSLKDLLEIVETTRDHGAGFRSLAEDMNITRRPADSCSMSLHSSPSSSGSGFQSVYGKDWRQLASAVESGVDPLPRQ